MADEKIEIALAEALDDTYETDSDMRAAEIIEILAAKNIRLFDFSPGELQVGMPLPMGISIRDCFAGEAFNALMNGIRSNNIYSSQGARNLALGQVREMAAFCYAAADAMMEAREISPEYAKPSPVMPQTEHVWTVKTNGSTYAVLAPNNMWYVSEAPRLDSARREVQDAWAKNECADLMGFNHIGPEKPGDVPEAGDVTGKQFLPEIRRLKWGIESVLSTFKKDEAQGFHTRDRIFAIEILTKALDPNFKVE